MWGMADLLVGLAVPSLRGSTKPGQLHWADKESNKDWLGAKIPSRKMIPVRHVAESVPFNALRRWCNGVGIGTFVPSLTAAMLLGWRVSVLHRLLRAIPVLVTIGDWSVPLVGAVIALAITFLTCSLRLHDRMSDALGIRERFDITVIMLPLAVGLGVRLGPRPFERLRANRTRLMTSAFYQYTEGTRPILKPRSVAAVTDRWSWFWILVEIEAIATVTAVILLMFDDSGLAALLFVTVIGTLPVLYIIRRQCDQYAQDQVYALLANQSACQAILQEFLVI